MEREDCQQGDKMYMYMPLEYAIRDIENAEIKVSTVNELNDPFEFLYGFSPVSIQNYNGNYNQLSSKLKEVFGDEKGLLCFSKCYGIAPMWSHYASKGSGVALEFEKTGDLHKVQYDLERPLVNKDLKDNNDQEFINFLIDRKSSDWEYEKEYRSVVELKDCTVHGGHYFYPMAKLPLSGIFLGVNCQISTVLMRQTLRNANVKFKGAFNPKCHITKLKMSDSGWQYEKDEDHSDDNPLSSED